MQIPYQSSSKIIKRESNGVRILNTIPIVLKFDIFSFIFNVLSVIFTSWIPFIIVRPDIVILSVPPGESALCSFILAKLFRPQSKLKKNNFRQNIGLRDNDFVLVFCGTIGGYYKLDILIKSLKNVNQKLPNVKLLLVGLAEEYYHIIK